MSFRYILFTDICALLAVLALFNMKATPTVLLDITAAVGSATLLLTYCFFVGTPLGAPLNSSKDSADQDS